MSGPPYLALSSSWEGIVSSSSLALRGCSYMCDWMRNSRALLNTWSGEKFPGQRGHTCFWIDLSYGELCLFLGILEVLVLANVTLLGDPEWAWLFVMAMMPTPEDSSHAPPQLFHFSSSAIPLSSLAFCDLISDCSWHGRLPRYVMFLQRYLRTKFNIQGVSWFVHTITFYFREKKKTFLSKYSIIYPQVH